MRFAYADPPYPGMAHFYPEKEEVNHSELIAQLENEFDGGWALSTGSVNLHHVLPLCPPTVRIAAWVKPFASFKPGVNPAYTWEPVIFHGGRKRGRDHLTVRDHLACGITLQKGMVGAKPEAFCYWIFNLLGMEPDDELVDLFPGTGVVGRCWEQYKANALMRV